MADQPKPMPTPTLPSELGYTGLRLTAGQIYEESRRDLVFPQSLYTYDKMSQNVAIAAAFNAVHVIASRTPFFVEPYSSQDVHVKRAEFVEQCMHDMEHSWYDFIREVMSFNKYGFSLHEKVFRYRRKERGSKYDDGKVGLRKLPIRSQASITEFVPDPSGRDIVAVKQQVNVLSSSIASNKTIELPMSRCLLFRVDPYKGNPQGVSPLNSCYQAWRMLQKLLDAELIATSKNLNGLIKGIIPAQFLSDDASPEDKAVAKAFTTGVVNTHTGEQQGFVIPSDRDGEGNRLFDVEIINSSSSNITALSDIIQRYTNEIYQCLFADVLQMGSQKSGNYNVIATKETMLELLVEARLKEITDVLNYNLIPDLFAKNGWDTTKCPKVCFGSLSRPDLSTWAKAFQQVKATKGIALTSANVNYIHEMFGFPDRVPDDTTQEELDKLLGVEKMEDSKSGAGYASDTGGLNGTADEVSEDDNTASNKEAK
jgi:hypothetical protein